MFIKKVTNKKQDTIYLTYRLVRSVRENGVPKHINVLELGSLNEVPANKHKALAVRIEQLIVQDSLLFENSDDQIEQWAHYFYKKLIKNHFNKTKTSVFPAKNGDENSTANTSKNENPVDAIQQVNLDSFETISSQEIGGEWLCTQAINELELSDFLHQQLQWNSNEITVGMLALLGRLLYPASELKTADWLNENSGAMELFSPQSGSIDRNRLMHCTKKLYQDKQAIENYLSQKIASIYNIETKLVLYDLTNTHFEGHMNQCSKAKYGRNKQKRNDCKQITLGLLTDQEGFCKQSMYYSGNIAEPKTFEQVLNGIKPFKNQKQPAVVVMDAGIASQENLEKSLAEGIDYICVSRASHNDLIAKVEKDKLVSFINKAEQEVKAQFFHQTIEYKINDQTYCRQETLLYVETLEKQAKENGIFSKKKQGFETGLQQIKESVSNPKNNIKNKSAAKIHERIGRLKEKYTAISQAYTINVVKDKDSVTDIVWEYNVENSIVPHLGTYFIRTSIQADNEAILWKTYRTIGEIESVFRTLKSDLDLRPVFHQKEFNIEAHLNLAVLSYFIVSFIRYKLKMNGINYCWQEIVRIMSAQKCSVSSIINTKKQKILLKTCTRPSLKVNQIYQAMKYKLMPFYRKKSILTFD